MVVKQRLEPLDPLFHKDSYGYCTMLLEEAQSYWDYAILPASFRASRAPQSAQETRCLSLGRMVQRRRAL
jgi:hypothetical protein